MDWDAEDYDWNGQELSASRRRGQGDSAVRCQVSGCNNDMQGLRPFYQRLRICEEHAKAHSVVDGSGRAVRFCQQCSKLQALEAFDGDRRSCVASLDKRRARRSTGGMHAGLAKVDSPGSPGAPELHTTVQPGTKRQRRQRLRESSTGSASSSGDHQSMLRGALRVKLRVGSAPSPGSQGGAPQRRGSGDSNNPAAASAQQQQHPEAAAAAGGQPGGWGRQQHDAPVQAAPLFGAPSGPQQIPPFQLQLPQLQQQLTANPSAALLLQQLQCLDAADTLQQYTAQQAAAASAAHLYGGGPVATAPLLAHPAAAVCGQVAGHTGYLPPTDLDLLLQLHPEDLADALLDYHSLCTTTTRVELADVPSVAVQAPAHQRGVGSTSPNRVSQQPALAGAHGGLPAQGSAARLGSAPGHSSGSGSAGGGLPDTTSPQAALAGAHLSSTGAGGSTTAGYPLPAWGHADEDRLVKFSFKLFDTTPDCLPGELREQLQTALALAPSVLHASMRAGCVCLTATALLSPAELERLHGCAGGLAGAVAAALALTQTGGKLLCHSGSQLSAASSSGALTHVRLPASGVVPVAPRLATPAVVLAGLGSGSDAAAMQAVLVGPRLADPAVVLHCRSRGRHQVLSVLAVRSGDGRWQRRLGGQDGPSTPPTTDRTSPAHSSQGSSQGSLGLSRSSSGGAPTTAAPTPPELLFELLELAPGQDAVLVSLPGPAQGWGLLEFELADGALLSPTTPLLVLPAWAEAAAAELESGLPACTGATAFLQHAGFMLHATETASSGQRSLEPAAAQRVSRLARSLAAFAASQGWLATGRLLLPAMAVAGGASGGSSSSGAASDWAKGGGPLASAAEAAVHGVKGASPEERQQLQRLLSCLERQGREEQAADEAADEAAVADVAHPGGLRSLLAATLADWLWSGCNLVVGAASPALIIRNTTADAP